MMELLLSMVAGVVPSPPLLWVVGMVCIDSGPTEVGDFQD